MSEVNEVGERCEWVTGDQGVSRCACHDSNDTLYVLPPL